MGRRKEGKEKEEERIEGKEEKVIEDLKKTE